MQVFELQYTLCDICERKKDVPDNEEFKWVQIWVDNTGFVHHREWQENSLMFATGYNFATGYKILDICSTNCLVKFLNDKRRKENGNG